MFSRKKNDVDRYINRPDKEFCNDRYGILGFLFRISSILHINIKN